MQCGDCPQLGTHSPNDITRFAWRHKSSHVGKSPVTVACPSSWLARCAKESSMFRNTDVLTIPYGMNLESFRPVPRATAREILGLPAEPLLILFGSIAPMEDPRKGFTWLYDALHHALLQQFSPRTHLAVFGARKAPEGVHFPMTTHFLGRVSDENSLRLIYSAADVFIAPSTEENLANTVLESLACGTPVVAFDIGGMPDMVRHRENGYLVPRVDAGELASGIRWMLEAGDRETLRRNARATMEQKFNVLQVAQQYIQLYSSILDVRRPGNGSPLQSALKNPAE